jgi:hypothetical protein
MVYQAVDAVFDRREGNVPPGTLATLYRALDELRDMNGCDGHVRCGGAIVVTLHRLQTILRDSAQPFAAAELRRDLALMQREWLVASPIRH